MTNNTIFKLSIIFLIFGIPWSSEYQSTFERRSFSKSEKFFSDFCIYSGHIKSIEKGVIIEESFKNDSICQKTIPFYRTTYDSNKTFIKKEFLNDDYSLDYYSLYKFNNLGLLIEEVAFDSGNTLKWKYTYSYDKLNRIIKFKYKDSKIFKVKKYEYNSNDSLTISSVFDKQGNILSKTVRTYDNKDQLIRIDYFENDTVGYNTFSWDLNGNLIERSFCWRKQKRCYKKIKHYDSLGRLTKIVVPNRKGKFRILEEYTYTAPNQKKMISYKAGGKKQSRVEYYSDSINCYSEIKDFNKKGKLIYNRKTKGEKDEFGNIVKVKREFISRGRFGRKKEGSTTAYSKIEYYSE